MRGDTTRTSHLVVSIEFNRLTAPQPEPRIYNTTIRITHTHTKKTPCYYKKTNRDRQTHMSFKDARIEQVLAIVVHEEIGHGRNITASRQSTRHPAAPPTHAARDRVNAPPHVVAVDRVTGPTAHSVRFHWEAVAPSRDGPGSGYSHHAVSVQTRRVTLARVPVGMHAVGCVRWNAACLPVYRAICTAQLSCLLGV